MNFDKKQLRNTLLLLLGALIWGTAFVAQSVGSGYVGPYTFLAARSWLACAFLIVLVLLRRGKARKDADHHAHKQRTGQKVVFGVCHDFFSSSVFALGLPCQCSAAPARRYGKSSIS